MDGWIKNYSRRANRKMRRLNSILLEDDVFKGRFQIKLLKLKHLNAYPYGVYQAIDNETGVVKVESFSLYSAYMFNKLFSFMNDFIVKDCKFWESSEVG